MRIIKNDYLHLAIRLIMGGIFLYAGWGKIVDPMDFASSIYNYKLLPVFMIGLAVVIIPWLEVLVGLSLVLGVKVKGGALVASLLLVVFILNMIISVTRGIDVGCGCFSGVDRTVNWLAITEDLIMLAGGLFVLFMDRIRITPLALLNMQTRMKGGKMEC